MLSFEHALQFTLVVNTWSSVSTTLTIRGITSEGVFAFKHAVTALGFLSTQVFAIPDIPITVSVIDETGASNESEVFVTVSLRTNDDPLYMLMSGYVHYYKPISWPYSNSAEMRPGKGRVKYVTGSNPAAGAEIVETVGSAAVWTPISFVAALVTDATVANRRPHLRITNAAGTVFFECFSDTDHVASTTYTYCFANFGAQPISLASNVVVVSLPDNLQMTAGMKIRTATINLQAGDNWGAPNYIIEQALSS